MANNPLLQSPFDKLAEDLNVEANAPLPGQQAAAPVTPMPEVPAGAPAAAPTSATAPAATPTAATTPAVPQEGRRPGKTSYLPPPALRPAFDSAAKQYDVPVNVLMALGHQESRYNAGAIGTETQWGRAKGMLQYLDSTAKGMGINPFDPVQAIGAAAKQIRERLDKGYSMEDAVKEHFAGPDRKKWGSKTAAYGREVMEKVGKIGGLLFEGGEGAPGSTIAPAQAATPGAPATAAPIPAGYKKLTQEDADQIETDNTPFLTRSKNALSTGYDNTMQSLDTARFAINGGDSAALAKSLHQKMLRTNATAKTTGQKEIDAGFQAVTDAKGWVDTTIAGAKAIGTSVANTKDLAVGILEQTANLIPTIGGAATGAGVGAATGAGVGSLAAGVGAGPGALAGAVWGGRAGALAGTAVTELGAETEHMLMKRLKASGQPVTEASIKSILDDKEFQAEARTQGTIKGVTIGVIDQLSMGLAGKILTAPGKAAAKTGVAATRAAKVGAATAATVVDATGEVVGEAASQKLARGEVDEAGEALREGVYGLGQSAVSPVIGAAVSKLGKRKLTAAQQFATEFEREVENTNFVGHDAAARAALDPNNEAIDPATTRRPVPPSQAAPVPAEVAPAPSTGKPLTAAVENAAAQEQRVIVQSPEGGAAGTLKAYEEDGEGGFVAQIVGDDGQVYTLTDQDGVQITPVAPPSGPLTAAIEEVAAQQPDAAPIPTVQPGPAMWRNADNDQPVNVIGIEPTPGSDGRTYAKVESGGQESFVPADELTQAPVAPAPAAPQSTMKPAEAPRQQPATKQVADMTDAELRTRMKYIAGQAKSTGWDKRLGDARREVEREINTRNQAAAAVESEAAKTAPIATAYPTQKEANAGALALAERTEQPHEVVETDGKFKVQPITGGNDGNAGAVGDGRGRGAGDADLDGPAVGNGPVSDGNAAGGNDVAGTGSPAGGQVSTADAGASPAAVEPAALKNEYATQWFGSQEKADGFIAKKKIGATHRVEQTGRSRYEIRPKAAEAKPDGRKKALDAEAKLNAQIEVANQKAAERAAEKKKVGPPNVTVGKADGWTNQNAQASRQLSDNKKLTERIEAAFATGATARQVQTALGADLDFLPADERAGFVVGVRATLGIPSQSDEDGKREFATWKAAYDDRKSATPEAKVPTMESMSGAKIDSEWTSFSDESGTMNIARAEMPQVKAEHRGALVNFLNARGIRHEQYENVPSTSLKPTQREFSPSKVAKAKAYEGGDRAILVSHDNHVIDGHHQWLAKLDTNEPIKIIKLYAEAKEVLEAVKEFPSSETSVGAKQTAENSGNETGDVVRFGNQPAESATESDEDTGADIPLAFYRKVKVQTEVMIEDEPGKTEMVEMSADKALASVREDIGNLKSLLKCLKG